MTVVRELLISFGVELDDNSLKNAEGKAKKTGKKIGDIFTSIITGLAIKRVGEFLWEVNRLASDVKETMNVIGEVFQESQSDVIAWSEAFAKAAGRSRFELRDTAGQIGAIVDPMVEGNKAATTEISTNLAALSVDLASFFNTTDKQARVALKSGLVGEMEPLRRFGVVMSVANLEAHALSIGMKKAYAEMSIAERIQLRYNFIMETTANAQGDAARTAGDWANSLKRFQGFLLDLRVTIGQKVQPTFKAFLRQAEKLIRFFDKLIGKTAAVEATLIVLGGAITAFAVKASIALAPLLIPFLKIGAIIGALILIVEDMIVAFQGGESVIGSLADSLFGPGSVAAAVDFLKDLWLALVFTWQKIVLPGIKDLQRAFKFFIDSNSENFQIFFATVGNILKSIWHAFSVIGNFLVDVVGPQFKHFTEIAFEALNGFLMWAEESFASFSTFLVDLFGVTSSDVMAIFDGLFGYIEKGLDFIGQKLGTFGDTITGVFDEAKSILGLEVGAIKNRDRDRKFFEARRARLRDGGGGVTNNTTNAPALSHQTNINIHGSANSATARQVGQVVERSNKSFNNRLLGAVAQRGS